MSNGRPARREDAAILLGGVVIADTDDPKAIHFSYRRYIENELREAFGFHGTPLRISFRSRHEPN